MDSWLPLMVLLYVGFALIIFAVYCVFAALTYLLLKYVLRLKGKKIIILALILGLILTIGFGIIHQTTRKQHQAQQEAHSNGTAPNSIIIACLRDPLPTVQAADKLVDRINKRGDIHNLEYLYASGQLSALAEPPITGFHFATDDHESQVANRQSFAAFTGSTPSKPLKTLTTGTRAEARAYKCQ